MLSAILKSDQIVTVSPITCKGHRVVTAFYATHFSLSQLYDGSAYLLSVAALPSLLPKGGSYQFIFPAEGERLGWPTCLLASAI